MILIILFIPKGLILSKRLCF